MLASIFARLKALPKLFNLCVVEDSKYQDLDLSVAFKAVAADA